MIKTVFKLLILVLVFNTHSNAQCGSFTKNKCLPKLKPFLNTQELANTVLLNGDKTQLTATFYYGDEYRLLICAQESLGKIKLNIKDTNDKIIFSTSAYGTIMWDFNLESTQDLTLEVISAPVDDTQPGGVYSSGCVSIMMGFK